VQWIGLYIEIKCVVAGRTRKTNWIQSSLVAIFWVTSVTKIHFLFWASKLQLLLNNAVVNNPVKSTDVSVERIAFILRLEKWAKQETKYKQGIVWVGILIDLSLDYEVDPYIDWFYRWVLKLETVLLWNISELSITSHLTVWGPEVHIMLLFLDISSYRYDNFPVFCFIYGVEVSVVMFRSVSAPRVFSSTISERISMKHLRWESGLSFKDVLVFLLWTMRFLCKIWGFHGGDYEEWCLLGCYAVWLL
jgi:hypothetical protein